MEKINNIKTGTFSGFLQKPIIVFDIMYAPSEEKQKDWESFKEKYDKLFEGYTVVYIDTSKQNTVSNNSPIYKL